jgi:predicted RNA-binding Zn-ribbon protein involved in translation (DUF1610 family)
MKATAKDYEYRVGHIEVLDRGAGALRCRECGTVWRAEALRQKSGRDVCACRNCGANSKGSYSL